MKTSSNNNNIESKNNNQEFFTNGKKYRCIKSVVMKKGDKTAFKAGNIYEQTNDPTHWVGWLRNEQGERHAWPQPVYIADEVKTWGTKPEDIDPRLYFEPVEEITEAEGVKVGDKVRHNKHEEVATVTAIREAFVNGCDGYRYLYTLDFGQSVKGPFDVELNGGEFLREAFTVVPDYYSEYQRLGHQEARPQEWLKKTTNEKRATYYRACVELERMAGDGLPLVIRADSADLSVNPWNALEKRVKTARVFHLGDRVKVKDGSREVTGIVNGIRCNEGSLALGGWCTHYNIQWDKQYQYTMGYGTATGCGNIGPERIELIERAEFCPEPASEWLQPGEKVAHYLDYGDGTGDWLIGNVTGYDLDDNGTVTVIYGEYRTPLKGMVKYQPEMDGKVA